MVTGQKIKGKLMTKKAELKRLLESLKRLIDLIFQRWRTRGSKRIFSLDSFLRRDLLVVFLILVLAVSSQFFSGYASSQTVLNNSSAPQSLPIVLWNTNPAGSILSAMPGQVEKPNENVVSTPTNPPSFISPTPTSLPSPSALPSSTNISLGLYKNNPNKNNNQSEILLDIDWSSMTPGEERNSSLIYYRNEGDSPFTMSFSTANWVFLDSSSNNLSQNYRSHFALRWDYDNSPLVVNEVRPVVFTLAVSSNIKDVVEFSFDIVTTATSSN